MRLGWKCSDMCKLAVRTLLAVGLVVGGSAVGQELPDPMRPPHVPSRTATVPVSAPSDWQLHMTRISPGQRLAVLNGRLVRPGDEVSGARVLSVGPSAVELSKGGKKFRVALSRASVKRPTAYGGVMMSEALQGHDP